MLIKISNNKILNKNQKTHFINLYRTQANIKPTKHFKNFFLFRNNCSFCLSFPSNYFTSNIFCNKIYIRTIQ